MTKFGKKYYRITELTKEWDMHIGEVLDYAEQGLLSLLFYSDGNVVDSEGKILPEGYLPITVNRGDRFFHKSAYAYSDFIIFNKDKSKPYTVPLTDKTVVRPSQSIIKQISITLLSLFHEEKSRFESLLNPEKVLTQGIVIDKGSPHVFPDEGNWEDVHIRFSSYEKAEIISRSIVVKGDYKKFGFVNKTDSKPIKEWETLHIMAQYDGKPPDNQKTNKNHVSDLQTKLKGLFPNIEGNPFAKYNKSNGWRPHLQLTPIKYPHSQSY